jgi:hypothetical protein
MKKILIFSFLLLFVSISASFAANEPFVISFQGKLDQVNDPNNVPLIFSIWNGEEQGQGMQLWISNTVTVTLDAQGIFNTHIGNEQNNALPFGEFGGNPLWVQVNVDGNNLYPRQLLSAAPYAISAKHLRGGNAMFQRNVTAYPVANASEGMMMYNDDRNKVAYSDGSKWIEIDPVYTSKAINAARIIEVPKPGGVADDFDTTVTILNPPSDCIITNIGISHWRTSNNIGARIILTVDDVEKVKYYPPIQAGGNNPYYSSEYTLPIPLKVNGGSAVKIQVSLLNSTGGIAGSYSSSLFGLYINFINLPL